MSGVPMHENELHGDGALGRSLLAELCPEWADRPPALPELRATPRHILRDVLADHGFGAEGR